MPTTKPAESWTARIWREFHADNLTRGMRDTLLTLATYRGAGGICTPSHATLAARIDGSVRTVQRALDQARNLGLVIWTERRIRRGWRWLRTSNAYRLMMPTEAVQPGQRPVSLRPSTTGHFGRGGESKKKEAGKAALEGMLREAAALPDLLTLRRGAMHVALLAARSARK